MQRVTYGLEPSTHRGVVHLLGDHFVKTGVLSAELGRLVSRMQRDREDAGAVFTDEQARAALEDARRFLERARELVGGP